MRKGTRGSQIGSRGIETKLTRGQILQRRYLRRKRGGSSDRSYFLAEAFRKPKRQSAATHVATKTAGMSKAAGPVLSTPIY